MKLIFSLFLLILFYVTNAMERDTIFARNEEGLLVPIQFQLTTGEIVTLDKGTAQKSHLIKNHLEDRGTEEIIGIPITCTASQWEAFWQCAHDKQKQPAVAKNNEAVVFLNLHNYLHMESKSAQQLSAMIAPTITLSNKEYRQEKIKRYIWMNKIMHASTASEILAVQAWLGKEGDFIVDCANIEKEIFVTSSLNKNRNWLYEEPTEKNIKESISGFYTLKFETYHLKEMYEKKKNIINYTWSFHDQNCYEIIVNKYPEQKLSYFKPPFLISEKNLNIRFWEQQVSIYKNLKEITLPDPLEGKKDGNELINNICISGKNSHIFIATTAYRLLAYSFNPYTEKRCVFLNQRKCNQEITALGDWPGLKTVFVGFKNGHIVGLGYKDIDAKYEPRMFFEKDDKPVRHIVVDCEGKYMIAASSNDYIIYGLKNINVKQQRLCDKKSTK